MDKDFTCACGHTNGFHLAEPLGTPICIECAYSRLNSAVYYPWHLFKPDNLRHLERLVNNNE